MKDLVDLVLCEPAPFLFGANGHFSVTDGSSVWIAVVTCEAMRATASPPSYAEQPRPLRRRVS
ncbi:hypothetical protein [Rhizobium halophilum]|uniref:hypothetical protein n=1 Tax=Rhizobium halophilum TaxID=2846852 RepID=UPI001EFCBA88|nr:hypothetical protein [Rhizobium halophilum]MCF6367318.1 hypothetical protein [Rhizobium halophilum]